MAMGMELRSAAQIGTATPSVRALAGAHRNTSAAIDYPRHSLNAAQRA